MEIKPVISNPYLGIKLDPGEPGLLNKIRANESTIRITAQEQRNLNRLVNQAVQEGRTVIWKGITYSPSMTGSFMGITSGHTTVISVERPEKETDLPSEIPENGTEALSDTGGDDDPYLTSQSSIPAPSLDTQSAGESPDELSQKEGLLRAGIGRLEAEIKEAESDQVNEENNLESAQSAREKQHLARELQEKEKELNKIAMERLIKIQSELMGAMNQGLIQNSLAPVSMVKAAYNAGAQTPSQDGFEKIA